MLVMTCNWRSYDNDMKYHTTLKTLYLFSVVVLWDYFWAVTNFGPTSHTRLRARDHYPLSTLIGSKGRAGPILLHTILRDQRSMWMQDGCKVYMDGFQHGIKWIMSCGQLEYFQKPPLGGRPNTKLWDHDSPGNRWSILFYHLWGPLWIEIHWNSIWLRARDHATWLWRVCWDVLWTHSFGLSQFHGHGSWLVCEVALCRIGSIF
jgi:hypothetical protein